MLKDPVLVAFTTSSSEAAYPKTLERLVKFGCSRNIVSFVLPIGYSFNLVGSMVYCSFAAMFIAQAYNVPLSFSEITVMMLTLMLASKGIAGVPRSALVVLAATIPSFNIPVAGILLLMGIDHFLDMGRSAINVLGNGIATAMLSKNERVADRRGSAAGLGSGESGSLILPRPFTEGAIPHGKKTPDRHVRGNVTKYQFSSCSVFFII